MSERPRDLKVRTYDYARSVVRVFRALPKDRVTKVEIRTTEFPSKEGMQGVGYSGLEATR